jgi:hypothetical protein
MKIGKVSHRAHKEHKGLKMNEKDGIKRVINGTIS